MPNQITQALEALNQELQDELKALAGEAEPASAFTSETEVVAMASVKVVFDMLMAHPALSSAAPSAACKMAAFCHLPCVTEHCIDSCFREQNDTRAAPSAAEPVALTKQKIEAEFLRICKLLPERRGLVGFDSFIDGVRFAERVHGITDAALSQGGGA
jgi:hypothetical protein